MSTELIAKPYIACTVLRMAAQPVALCTQETSSLDLNGQDIVSLMVRAAELEHPADWLIQSKHNRTLPKFGKHYGRR